MTLHVPPVVRVPPVESTGLDDLRLNLAILLQQALRLASFTEFLPQLLPTSPRCGARAKRQVYILQFLNILFTYFVGLSASDKRNVSLTIFPIYIIFCSPSYTDVKCGELRQKN
jgi:hypothetical protein